LLLPPPFVEAPACPFIGSRGGRDAEGCPRSVVFVERCGCCCSDVSREWSAIPGHHGDVEDEMVKRLWILWHAGLASLLTGGWSRLGRGWVEVGRRGRDKAESREFWGMILVVFSLEGDQWWNSAWHGVYSDRFSPPIPGWTVKSEI
jgi:hypothetical protein